MDNSAPEWYRQSLYEQSWENYRNEDDNYRTTLTHYLAFVAGIVLVMSQAKDASRWLAVAGLVVSIAAAAHLGRVTMYSKRWLLAKDRAAGDQAEAEFADLKAARKGLDRIDRSLSIVPGRLAMYVMPSVGLLLFLVIAIQGSDFWG